jgi:hypothetical protein
MIAPHTLVVIGNVIQLQPCALYKHTCAVIHNHHVCPRSWWEAAGLPVDTPMIMLCPDCHYATHAALDGRIRGRDVSLLPPRCVYLAGRALEIAEAHGLTPELTL